MADLDALPGRVSSSSYGIIARALVLTAGLVALKWIVHDRDLEFIQSLPLLTALMGGVIFTLAIILSGVLADFKESERILGELSSTIRRLHADVETIATGERLAAMRRHILDAARALLGSLADGQAIRMRDVFGPLDALDAKIVEQIRTVGPSPVMRTVQVNVGNVVRIAERLEVVIETTFMKAGYYFAGITVTGAIAALTFTQLASFLEDIVLHGFASFLLTGLMILVMELDNPFSGSVRISIRQMEKTTAYLETQAATNAA